MGNYRQSRTAANTLEISSDLPGFDLCRCQLEPFGMVAFDHLDSFLAPQWRLHFMQQKAFRIVLDDYLKA